MVLLAVFNDGAMIALAKDRVTPSRTPNRWNLTAIFVEGLPLSPLPHAARDTRKLNETWSAMIAQFQPCLRSMNWHAVWSKGVKIQ